MATAALPVRSDVSPFDNLHPDACRRLWSAVLAEAWRQAFHPWSTETPGHVAEARRWFGTHDFRLVCGLVDVDPDDVMAAFRRAVRGAAPRTPRRHEVAA